MIIRLREGAEPAVVEPLDLKRFHIEAPGLEDDASALEAALKDFAAFAAPDHAWVSVAALAAWPGHADDPDYRDAVAKLVEVARKYGWYNEAAAAIKAHIEFACAD